MSWSRDGSGLMVYRHRGRTAGQDYAPNPGDGPIGPFWRKWKRRRYTAHWDPAASARPRTRRAIKQEAAELRSICN
jgi:hypothetical protein